MENLQEVSKLAYQKARDRYLEGSVPLFLGTNGLLALAHQNIQRYIDNSDFDTLVDIVAFSIFALAKEHEDGQFRDLLDHIPPEEDEEELPGDDECLHENTIVSEGYLHCLDCSMPLRTAREGDEDEVEFTDAEENEEAEEAKEESDTD